MNIQSRICFPKLLLIYHHLYMYVLQNLLMCKSCRSFIRYIFIYKMWIRKKSWKLQNCLITISPDREYLYIVFFIFTHQHSCPDLKIINQVITFVIIMIPRNQIRTGWFLHFVLEKMKGFFHRKKYDFKMKMKFSKDFLPGVFRMKKDIHNFLGKYCTFFICLIFS